MSFHEFHSFKGERTNLKVKQGWTSQASDRDIGRSFDQWGRPWVWPRDKSTGMPCGPLEPDGWTAPWLPDQGPQFLVLNTENTTELYVNTRAIVQSRVASLKEYHARACKRAVKLGQPAPKVGQYSDEIVEAEGEPPRAYQFAIACEQGNPYALGFTAVEDERLVPYLEGPSKEVEEAFDAYDFAPRQDFTPRPGLGGGHASVAGYEGATASQPANLERAKGKRFQSFQELREQMLDGETTAEEVNALDAMDALVADGATDGSESETDDAIEIDDATGLPLADDASTVELIDDVGPAPKLTHVANPKAPARAKKEAPVAKPDGPPRATKRAKPFVRDGRKTVADGARPVVGVAEE